ncbi:MAG: putative Fe-S oxidoreductase [Promethearchaeota archaeon CR_4]|nr:MAG: putative Fe-S oxidoreductase [Candidatus Lokiarchaeota archaeon CR_4]
MELQQVIHSRKGVRFHCASCGRCCSGESEGLVFLYRDDIRNIASFLMMSEAYFLLNYCDVVDAAYKSAYVPTIIIKLNPNTSSCLFQKNDGNCTIYPVRPFQCVSFPFWHLNLVNEQSWERIKENCPGLSTPKQGHLYTIEEINVFLDKERQLEDDYFQFLEQNDFKLTKIYPCLEKKETASNVT